MKILIEALHINFEYITGIERHLLLQLEIFEKFGFNISIVSKHKIQLEKYFHDFKINYIIFEGNSKREWKTLFENNSFDFIYSTFVPPAFIPSITPVFYVLHDPGRYLFPDLMDTLISEHTVLFDKYKSHKNFHIITVSESSKEDILKIFPELNDKIFVVYNFVSKFLILRKTDVFLKNEIIPEKYFLTIGKYIPTKNTLNIVKAFENRSNVFKDYKLIIIGRKGWYDSLDNYLISHNKNIISIDYIEDNYLKYLYGNSYAYVSASLYEGFGITLLEAIVLGNTLVFCSNIPVFKELNLPNTTYFDPLNIHDISKKVFDKKVEKKYNAKNRFDFDNALNQFSKLIKTTMNYEIN